MTQPAINRRRFLTISAAGAAAFLAACGGAGAPAAAPSSPAASSAAAAVPAASPASASSAASSAAASSPAAASATGTLTVSQGADATDLNPFQTSGVPGIYPTLYDKLIVRDASNKIVPSLATSWKNLDDTTVEFKLRQGVKFHNGEPFDANSVKWSFEQFVDPKNKNIYASMLTPVAGVQIIDDSTVHVLTKTPFPSLIENMAYGVWMGPPKAMQEQGDAFLKHPIGTGPFKFVSWAPGEKLVVESAGQHFAGTPKLKTVVWQPIEEEASRITALRTGAADLIAGIAPADLDSVTSQQGLKVSQIPSQSLLCVILNAGRAPFNNKLVRQAMNYAVDKEGIIKSLLRGIGSVAPAPTSPVHEGYDPNLKPIYDYNPDKAKQLLAQAGYANGFSVKLDATDGKYLQDKQIAEAIAGQLGKVGVKVQVQTYEWGAFVNLLGAKTSDMTLIQQGGSTTDNLYPACFSSKVKGLPWLGYSNPQADDLIDKARSTVDADQRNATYRQLVKLLQDDAPWIYLHYQTNIFGLKSNVQGFQPRTDGEIIVQPISLS